MASKVSVPMEADALPPATPSGILPIVLADKGVQIKADVRGQIV